MDAETLPITVAEFEWIQDLLSKANPSMGLMLTPHLDLYTTPSFTVS
jgi:hypothetical protein